MERETGFEPATPSLEGSRSSQLSYSRQTIVSAAIDTQKNPRTPPSGDPICGGSFRFNQTPHLQPDGGERRI